MTWQETPWEESRRFSVWVWVQFISTRWLGNCAFEEKDQVCGSQWAMSCQGPLPLFLKRQSGENEDITDILPLLKHTVLEIHNISKAKQKICAIFGNSIFDGGGLFSVIFILRLGWRRVLGLIHMSSLPFCHSSICLNFYLFIFTAGCYRCRVRSLNQGNFLIVYIGSKIMLNI